VTVVLYCRYSSTKQSEGFSISAQLSACREYCQKNNLIILKEYVDEAISGRSCDRPQFNLMLEDSKSKEFTQIIVHKFDRFSRDRTDSVVIKSQLKKNNVDVISVSEPIDNSNAYGVVMESLYESLSHAYSQNLARESLKGMIEAVKAGFHVVGKPPFGYQLKKVKYKNKMRSKLIINEEEGKIVKLIYCKYLNENLGIKCITKFLNENGYRTRSGTFFSSSGVCKILKSKTLTGTIDYNKSEKFGYPHIQIPKNHAPLISEDEYQKVQNIMKQRYTTKVKLKSDFILSGILKCSCGSSMSGISGTSKNGQKHHYYSCINKIKKGICKQSNIRRDWLDDLIINAFRTEIINKKTIRTITQQTVESISNKNKKIHDEIKRLKNQFQTIKNKYDKLLNLVETQDDIDYSDVGPRIKEHKLAMDNINIQIQNKNIETTQNTSIKLNTNQIKTQVISLIDTINFNKKTIRDHIRHIKIEQDYMIINWCLLNESTGSPFDPIKEHFTFYYQLKIA